jgi:CBS domain-containing protein
MATIREVMSKDIVTVEPSATVAEAATVMGERRVGSVLVLEQGTLAGIFTERDIVKALANHFDAAGHPVGQWMTRDPITIGPDARIEDALDRMLSGNFRHLPVVDGDSLLGVVSIRDLSQAAAERSD